MYCIYKQYLSNVILYIYDLKGLYIYKDARGLRVHINSSLSEGELWSWITVLFSLMMIWFQSGSKNIYHLQNIYPWWVTDHWLCWVQEILFKLTYTHIYRNYAAIPPLIEKCAWGVIHKDLAWVVPTQRLSQVHVYIYEYLNQCLSPKEINQYLTFY